MKITIAHNRYQQAGGEDKVVAAEAALLSRRGHQVEMLAFDNEAIGSSPAARVTAAVGSFGSLPSFRRVRAELSRFQPDVLHVHNFMPTLSPAIFFAAAKAHVPVVQTLHNFRLICANAQLFREGTTCELCLQQRSFLPSVRHGCYRSSRLGSAVVGGAMAAHAAVGTWQNRVDRYIALSTFAAGKLGGSRVPAHKIRVKPNFVVDNGLGQGDAGFALYVGRLSEEKGLATLIAADALGKLERPVHIAGDGPMRSEVERACARAGGRLRYLGPQSEEGVRALMRAATVLLVPSLWYEGFPMVMVEALSLGLPVIASRIGGLPEIIEDAVCGFLHAPGDASALGDALRKFAALAPQQVGAMREAARTRFKRRYSEDTNYELLMQIYAEAIATKRQQPIAALQLL